MRRVLKLLAILLSISGVFAGDKDARFITKPAAEYPNRVTQEKVTVAAMAYVNEEDLHLAFGKADPNKYVVLPVLVVIHNDSDKAIRLSLQAEFVDAKDHHVDATPASEVRFVGAPPKRKDSNIGMGSPLPFPLPKKGAPLGGWEIDGRALRAKMVPPGEQVSGFFYFQARMESGGKLYLNGLSDAATGKELFYFEVPLDK